MYLSVQSCYDGRGAVTRDDFDQTRSEVDVLVKFEPDTPVWGYVWYDSLSLLTLEEALARMFRHRVDLLPKEEPVPYIPDEVLCSRVVIYRAPPAGNRLRETGTPYEGGSKAGAKPTREGKGAVDAGRSRNRTCTACTSGNRDKQLVLGKLLEKIGENAGKLDPVWRESHPGITWQDNHNLPKQDGPCLQAYP